MICTGLTYQAKGFTLGPLDLDGPQDRPWLFLGPSGSGKTTLLKLIAGRITPLAGSMTAQAGCAYLPQRPESVLVGRNLAEDLTGSVRPRAEDRAALRSLLAVVGLDALPLTKRGDTLSAGERRRVGLAMIAASPHRVWALDEPDAGLDRVSLPPLLELIKSSTDNGVMIYVSSHQPERFASLNPWVVVLDLGSVIATGTWAEVIASEPAQQVLGIQDALPLRLWKSLGHPSGELVSSARVSEPSGEGLLRAVLRRKLGILDTHPPR